MKHASPAVIMDSMISPAVSGKGKKGEVMRERVKSHLQKYRNNSSKSKADFLKEYDAWMGKALALQGGQASLSGLMGGGKQPLLGGDLPAFLSYSVMREENAPLGGGGPSSSPPSASFAGGVMLGRRGTTTGRPLPLTRAVLRDMAAGYTRRCFTLGARVPYPILTDEERGSPLGASLEQVISLLQPMTQWLMQERIRDGGERRKRSPPAAAYEPPHSQTLDTAASSASFPQVQNQAMHRLVANLPGHFTSLQQQQQDQQQHEDFQRWSKQEVDRAAAAHISQPWDMYDQQQRQQQQHHPRPEDIQGFSGISPFHTDSIVQQQNRGGPSQELQYGGPNQCAITTVATASLGNASEEDAEQLRTLEEQVRKEVARQLAEEVQRGSQSEYAISTAAAATLGGACEEDAESRALKEQVRKEVARQLGGKRHRGGGDHEGWLTERGSGGRPSRELQHSSQNDYTITTAAASGDSREVDVSSTEDASFPGDPWSADSYLGL